MKITLYWSEYSNRIYYIRYGCVYKIDGEKVDVPRWVVEGGYPIQKIGEI